MTYYGFLIAFLGVPIVVLALLTRRDARRGLRLPRGLDLALPWLVLLLHVVLAVAWTTPWDNYLVATGVWNYNPRLVTGLTLGWVPVEEYIFFVAQTLMTGLWLLWLARRMPISSPPAASRPRLLLAPAAFAALASIVALLVWRSGWKPGTYLALEIGWLLLPVIPQLLVGADSLWRQRRLVLAALLPPWLYLSAADLLAIGSGTWTISPTQSSGVLVGGVLPVEEVLFFLLTNMLIVFGMVLVLSLDRAAVRERLRQVWQSSRRTQIPV